MTIIAKFCVGADQVRGRADGAVLVAESGPLFFVSLDGDEHVLPNGQREASFRSKDEAFKYAIELLELIIESFE